MSIGSGGARGIVALGALAPLQRAGYFSGVAEYRGSSVGAVLAAGLALGVPPHRMLRACTKNALQTDGGPGAAAGFGIDGGRGLARWITRVLRLRRPLCLREVPALTVCVTNLDARRAEYWSARTHPDADLVSVLRTSCSVPLVFASVVHGGVRYVDGGVADPLPAADFRIAFARPPAAPDTVGAFVAALSECPAPPPAARDVLVLDPGDITPLDFGLDAAALAAAYASGAAQARAFVKKNA